MNSAFDATAEFVAGTAAGQFLDDLMARFGVDGLVAALRCPGLLAEVDQHAAAVREALRARAGGVDAAGLAGYARSVGAAAVRMGRPLPVDGTMVDWARAGWHLLRLVAVCAVADEGGWL